MESGRIHVIVDVHSIFLCPQWSRCGLQGSKRALSNSGWIILLKIVFGPRRSVLMLKGFSLWMMQLNLIRDLLYSSINGDKRTWDRSAQEIWSRCGLERSKRALSNSGWIILLKIVFGPRKLQPPGGLWRWKYFGFLGEWWSVHCGWCNWTWSETFFILQSMVTRGLGTEVHKKYEADVKESLIKFWLDHLAEDNTPCPQKKSSVCILAITSSNLNKIQKVTTVLKSAFSQLFKTVLTFDFWPSRSWDYWS